MLQGPPRRVTRFFWEHWKQLWSSGLGLPGVNPSYTWVREYAYKPRGLGRRKGVATWFLGPRTNLDSMHKATSLGLGPELSYFLGKVLGTQDHLAFRLAFIYITFGLIWQQHLLSKPLPYKQYIKACNNQEWRDTIWEGNSNIEYDMWESLQIQYKYMGMWDKARHNMGRCNMKRLHQHVNAWACEITRYNINM